MPYTEISMRLPLLVLSLALAAQAQDALDIVRRAIETDHRNLEALRRYTYTQRQEQREIDSTGRVKKLESSTFEVLLLEGSPYRHLVARNDQPLPAKDQRIEDDKLRQTVTTRGRETKEQRDARIAEWYRKQERQLDPAKQIPEAFTFVLSGSETLNGADTWIIDASPRPGYKPRTQSTSFFPKVKFRLWVEKSAYQWIKLDMESLDTISFAGFLIRMSRGSHLTAENNRLSPDLCAPARWTLQGSVRIALIKLLRGQLTYSFTNYKLAS